MFDNPKNLKGFTLHLLRATKNIFKLTYSKKDAGFTIIETLVTIVIFSIAMGIIVGFIVYSYRVHYYAWEQSQAVGEAQKAVETMIKEIREAKPGEDGSYIIEKAENFDVIFYSDIDQDLETERVRYYVQGADLIKEITNPEGFPPQYSLESTEVYLSRCVQNVPPIFRYYDENGEELAAPARKKDTKMIKLYLEVNVNPSRLPSSFVLENFIRFRNL